MAANKQLARFVRDALAEGRNRAEIESALTDAGWSPSEVGESLGAWADTAFVPPVPRPQSVVSARDFFVYTLTFGALICLATYFILLSHDLIDRAWGVDFRSWRTDSMRWDMAMIIVSGPLYLWLALRDRSRLAADPSLYRSAIRKWLTYITLLLAAFVLLGVLVTVIHAFLKGDFTFQFAAKAAATGITAGCLFAYYLRDTRDGDAQ